MSPGEILGCTAPKMCDVDILIYVGDGRFHLESIKTQQTQGHAAVPRKDSRMITGAWLPIKKSEGPQTSEETSGVRQTMAAQIALDTDPLFIIILIPACCVSFTKS